jgi:general stress protein 26
VRNYSRIALTPAEANEFLDSELWIRVAVSSDDGRLLNLPTHFVRLGDKLYWDDAPDSLLVRSIRNNPHVCAVADTGYSYDDLVGIIMQADAHVIDSGPLVEKVYEMVREKYHRLTRRSPPYPPDGRVVVELRPRRALHEVSWHFGKSRHL